MFTIDVLRLALRWMTKHGRGCREYTFDLIEMMCSDSTDPIPRLLMSDKQAYLSDSTIIWALETWITQLESEDKVQ